MKAGLPNRGPTTTPSARFRFRYSFETAQPNNYQYRPAAERIELACITPLSRRKDHSRQNTCRFANECPLQPRLEQEWRGSLPTTAAQLPPLRSTAQFGRPSLKQATE